MLSFNGIQPISFGGVECAPKAIDAEKRLRLAEVDYSTAEKAEKSDDVLAGCFDDETAKDYIRNRLSPDDKIVIATYLRGGETALNRLNDATSQAIDKYIERGANV